MPPEKLPRPNKRKRSKGYKDLHSSLGIQSDYLYLQVLVKGGYQETDVTKKLGTRDFDVSVPLHESSPTLR